MKTVLNEDISEKQEIKNQPNLIKWYKEKSKWLVNRLRNSKFETLYYSKGVNPEKWEIP